MIYGGIVSYFDALKVCFGLRKGLKESFHQADFKQSSHSLQVLIKTFLFLAPTGAQEVKVSSVRAM